MSIMDHIYKDIGGWFDFTRFYDSVIDRLSSGFIFIEVGVWKGKSLSYFTVECLNKNKLGKIYAVDHWKGSEEHQKNAWAYDPATDIEDGLYYEYCKNISPIREYITDIKEPSATAAKLFDNHSIDAIFIDASHDYENVLQDLFSWKEKIKQDGIMSGHDYDWESVRKAVDEFAKKNNLSVTSYKSVWELTPN